MPEREESACGRFRRAVIVRAVQPSVYLIHGDDEFQVSRTAREKVDSLLPADQQAFGLETISVQEPTVDSVVSAITRCLLALKTVGFMTSSRVIWLRDLQLPRETRKGIPEAIGRRLDDLAALIHAGLSAGDHLVISAPATVGSAALVAACRAKGAVVEHCLSRKTSEERKHSEQVLADLLSEKGVQMNGAARELFRGMVGADAREIDSELSKLAVYAGAKKAVEPEDVEAITSRSRESRMWDLGNAVAERSLDRALNVLRQLLFQKESPIGIIVHLQNRIRDLIILREAMDRKWLRLRTGPQGRATAEWTRVPDEAERIYASGLNTDPRKIVPYQLSMRASEAARFRRGELVKCQECLATAHQDLLTGALPDSLALEMILLKMLA